MDGWMDGWMVKLGIIPDLEQEMKKRKGGRTKGRDWEESLVFVGTVLYRSTV